MKAEPGQLILLESLTENVELNCRKRFSFLFAGRINVHCQNSGAWRLIIDMRRLILLHKLSG